MNEQEILGMIGQLEASITKVEKHLHNDEYREYCDAIYTAITYWRTILKQIRDEKSDL